MAISSYDELKTALANWMARDDLTSRIPEFIALFEAKVKRELRLREMETDSASAIGPTVAGTAAYNLPSGFLEFGQVRLNTDPRRVILPAPVNWADEEWPNSTQGVPRHYVIEGTTLRFLPVPDAAYTIRSLHYAFTNLTSGTNWLLTAHPDAYLYGSLVHAEPYRKNDARAQTWKAFFDDAWAPLKKADKRARFGPVPQQRNQYREGRWQSC